MPNRMLLAVFLIFTALQVQATRVAYYQVDERYQYQHRLLQRVLEVTEVEFGEFNLQPLDKKVTQKRGLKFLENETIDLIYLAVNQDLLNRFTAIKYPLQRGLLGYRLLLTTYGKKQLLQRESLDTIQKDWTLGFGAHWSDLAILKHNHFNVVTSVQYENLFKMLHYQRFDIFPRGLGEAYSEIEKYSPLYPDIAVAEGVAFYYPYPVYYFVNRKNKRLAKRLNKGLAILSQSGEFEQIFKQHFGPILSLGGVNERKVWLLENPALPEGIQSPDTSSWLPANKLHKTD